ncbi:MAG TPA: acyl-CoA thioesterase domain-containing protein [Acidimicrobiia bacterium]|nr:acyl-CoA thioesterase domain-containing protein [Acidimicrobiia bacterium]
MTTAADVLGFQPDGVERARFALGDDLHGAFGGVFGGAVAAACVMAARPVAPGRRPFSAHVTFARGLSTPTCTTEAVVVASGRTVTSVGVDLADANGKIAARATVTFAADAALHPVSDPGAVPVPDLAAHDDGTPLRMVADLQPPIAKALSPRIVGQPAGGYAHSIVLPWDDSAAGAESMCMAADFCVGVPVGAVLRGEWVPIPNPDLSLRFLTPTTTGATLVGVGRLAGAEAGVAATQVEVWDGDRLVAIGSSSTVMLGGGVGSR